MELSLSEGNSSLPQQTADSREIIAELVEHAQYIPGGNGRKSKYHLGAHAY